MKSNFTRICVVALALGASAVHAVDIGTAFTYQGTLENGDGPVTDTCDIRLGLWDADAAGNQVGTSPQTVGTVDVIDGAFSVGVDFGAGAIDGTARWLEIEVQCPGDAGFTLLSPRVELTPAPHALALPGLYTLQNAISPNLIGGFFGNSVTDGVIGATIAGGGRTDDGSGDADNNRVTDDFGTVGGGRGNQAGNNASGTVDRSYATVSGGLSNTASGAWSTVGGGLSNTASGAWSTVGGGTGNVANNTYTTVGGGENNVSSAPNTTVCGGENNTALSNNATVAGGRDNTASGGSCFVGAGINNMAGGFSTVIGGGNNNVTSDFLSVVGGGSANTATGSYSVVPGGHTNLAGGDYGFAAGKRAKARDGDSSSPYYSGDSNGDEGTFIWADSTDADFISTGPNQFLIRAAGGVGIGTNDPTDPLTVAGVIRSTTGGFELPDGTIIDAASDFGDITAVNAGTGLTGGGTSGSVTLNVAFAGTGAANTSARSDHYHSTLAASDGSPSNAVTVDAAGRVGINNSPDTNYQLNVAGTSGIQIIAVGGSSFGLNAINTGSGGTGVIGSTTIPSGVNYGVRGNSASPSGFDFFAMGAGTDYGSSSSIRWKSNIRSIDNPLDKVARLRGVYYDWDAEHGGHHDVGMIAEEVGAVLPEIVAYEENGVDAIGLDYSKLSPLLIEAVKALQARVEHLEAEQRSTALTGEMISAGAPIVLVGLVGMAALRRRNNKGDNQ